MSPPASPRTARFHVGFGLACISTPAIGNITDTYSSAGFPIKKPVNGSDHVTWNPAAEYSLTHHFRLGLSFTQIPDLAFHSVQEGVGASEGATAMSYGILLEYVPSPVVYLFLSKLEFTVGAGVVYNSISVWNCLYSYDNAGGPSEDVFNEVKKKALGLHLRAGLDYFFHGNLSCQFKIDGKIIRSIHMLAASYTNPLVDETYELPYHSINFSLPDLSVCPRFHF
jgi:hypothetical protein